VSESSDTTLPAWFLDGRNGLGRADGDGYAAGMPGLDDFDRYVVEHGSPEEHYPAAFALWYAEATAPVARAMAGELTC
jgi:hypothetical protein